MDETFEKLREEDGKIILERSQTIEIEKEKMLENLQINLENINNELIDVEKRKAAIEAQISDIEKIK